MPGTKKAVFFDLGGTLLKMRRDVIFQRVLTEEGHRVSTEKIHTAYVKAEPPWLIVYGFRTMTPEETTESYRRLDVTVFEQLFPGASEGEGERFSKVLRRRWPELEPDFPPELYPDVEPTLKKLRQDGYKLAIVSNAPPDTVEVIEKLGLHRYMEHFVVSGVVGFSKPNPEIFRIALRGVNVGPSQAVHVGDVYEADVAGARNAGMVGILLDRDGSDSEHDCPRIHSLGEVYRYVS